MGTDKWFLLSRLRRAVKKVRFLINFNLNRWRVVSMIRGRSFGSACRRFSFNDRPGLTCAYDEDSGSEDQDHSGKGSSKGLQRTISYPLSDQDDNIDQRAEMFIANFRRQLQIERQVSLELRYYNRGNSFEWRSP